MGIDAGALEAGDAAAEFIATVRAWKAERKININADISRLEIIGGDSAMYRMSEEDIRSAMDPNNYTGGAKEIVDKMVAEVEEKLKVRI